MKIKYGLYLIMSSLIFTTPMTVSATTSEQKEIVEVIEENSSSVIYHTDTKSSEETPHQVNAVFLIPPGFNLNAYCQIMNTENGQLYQITATDENGYTDWIYLPNGNYKIIKYGLINDEMSEYPFITDCTDFSLIDDNPVTTLEFKIEAYDEIQKTIIERKTASIQTEEISDISKETELNKEINKEEENPYGLATELYNTQINDIKIDGSSFPYYNVISNSQNCIVEIYGNAIGNYDVYIEIIKAGVVNEAEFKLSLDGGKTFLGTDITSDDYDLSSYGLHLLFHTQKDTDELQIGDTFISTIPQTYFVSNEKVDKNNLIISGSPKVNYGDITIEILSSGNRGVAKFKYSDVTSSFVDIIPQDGLYKYNELSFHFSDGEYNKGQTYTTKIESYYEEVDNKPLYILIGVIIFTVIIIYIFLLSKKENKSNYKLHVWIDRQEEDKYK